MQISEYPAHGAGLPPNHQTNIYAQGLALTVKDRTLALWVAQYGVTQYEDLEVKHLDSQMVHISKFDVICLLAHGPTVTESDSWTRLLKITPRVDCLLSSGNDLSLAFNPRMGMSAQN
jgi:hypothetical protein